MIPDCRMAAMVGLDIDKLLRQRRKFHGVEYGCSSNVWRWEEMFLRPQCCQRSFAVKDWNRIMLDDMQLFINRSVMRCYEQNSASY